VKFTRNAKIATGAVAALAVAGGGAAIAANQLDSPSATSAAIVTDAANQLGIQPDALTAALKKAEEDQIDKAVAAGTITKEQGDAQKAAIESGQIPVIGIGGGHGPYGFSVHFDGPGPLADLTVAANFLGVTPAQLQSDLASGKSLADVATAQGKTPADLVTALVNAAKTQIDQAVKDGKLTQDQATQAEAALDQRVTDLVNGKVPVPGPLGMGGGFHHGFGDHFGPGGGQGSLQAAADYLGVSVETLVTDLQNGKTMADLAKDQGKSVDGLVTAMVDAQKTALDAAAKDGDLTADQEAAIEANLTQRTTDLVNGTFPPFEGGYGHFRRAPGPGGPWVGPPNGQVQPALGGPAAVA
jgi:hypothetical protein